MIVISGPSGSSKTTLANLITGLIKPNEGEILVMITKILIIIHCRGNQKWIRISVNFFLNHH